MLTDGISTFSTEVIFNYFLNIPYILIILTHCNILYLYPLMSCIVCHSYKQSVFFLLYFMLALVSCLKKSFLPHVLVSVHIYFFRSIKKHFYIENFNSSGIDFGIRWSKNVTLFFLNVCVCVC